MKHRYSRLWKWLDRLGHPDSQGRHSRMGIQLANVFNNLDLNTKAEIRQAFESGRLNPRKVRHYGWESHREVAKWLGLPEPIKPSKQPRFCPHCGGRV